ncbi:MAG TPA: tRNA uridine-5-carboxymethylaminomethyl(34) synthesis GTPase MnmE [Rudaea sp.]
MTSSDTIAAVATAPGAGGVGIVRLSGPASLSIAAQIVGRPAASFTPRHARFIAFRDGDGRVLDRGLALFFAQPNSFTGEDVVELHAHGSPVLLDLLLRRALALGARAARPGEFSERAFLNGKIDLAQAEAIADLVASGSESAARAAMRSLDGEFSRRVQALFDAVVRVRAWLEAALDFPEEEIDFLSAPQLTHDLTALVDRIDELLRAAQRGVRLRDGLHVVIVGRPNTGKSSLLNALARSDRAIVTAIAGTTRDVLREHLALDGVGLTLVDTAGLRESEDVVEREGIRRARAELERADVVLLMTDAPDAEVDDALLADVPRAATVLVVHNKIDLTGEAPRVVRAAGKIHIYLSAQRGDGVALLASELVRLAGRGEGSEGAFSARTRHVDALARVAQHAAATQAMLRERNAGELAAEELRRAQQALGEITGEYSSDDLLGAIFSTFCIGK